MRPDKCPSPHPDHAPSREPRRRPCADASARAAERPPHRLGGLLRRAFVRLGPLAGLRHSCRYDRGRGPIIQLQSTAGKEKAWRDVEIKRAAIHFPTLGGVRRKESAARQLLCTSTLSLQRLFTSDID